MPTKMMQKLLVSYGRICSANNAMQKLSYFGPVHISMLPIFHETIMIFMTTRTRSVRIALRKVVLQLIKCMTQPTIQEYSFDY